MAGRQGPAGAIPTPPRRRRAVAVDGKTLRGARHAPAGCQVHLLAAMDHTTRAVLAQRQVDAPPAKSLASSRCLPPRPRRNGGRRRRAPHPRRHRRVPRFQQAGALPVHRQGQPAHPAGPLRPPAWHHVPELDRTRDRGHGRIELRTLKAVSVPQFGFPHAAQVTRKTRDLHASARRWHTVTVYAISSLTFAQASPARLADLQRGHWAIENGLHYARDVTFAEDASRSARTPSRGPWPACAASPSASCGGTSQYRRRAAAQRPRRHQIPATPRHHKPVKPTLRHHAGP